MIAEMRPFVAALAAVSLSSSVAHALQQPNGTTIPVLDGSVTTCSDKNVQMCLNQEEGGPTINAQAAAAVLPETFNPTCGLTFKVIARGAGYLNTFGWYNKNPNGKPADSDLHAFLLCNDAPGTTKTLSIQNDPAYLGGEIGFFMASPEGVSGNCPQFNPGGGPVPGTVGHVYYSERKYNPDNVGANSTIHLIIWDSVTHKDSFYFGWEDLLAGGDNDFDDLLTRVEGITCSGGGAPCDTGKLGKCADGTMQCVNGTLTCVQNQQPTAETCNARDDDCDGTPDNGDLCPTGLVCDRGKCVPKCGTGEFACAPSLVCSSAGLCVDPKCETVTCNPGEVCVGGKCQAPCDGVACPFGQVCREGACVDPCDGLTCDQNYVCVAGVCTLKCSCKGCDANQSCDQSTEKCADTGCVPNPCGAGQHCVAGSCVDDCAGATCPVGQTCQAGQCVDAPDAGAGGGSGGLLSDGGLAGNAGSGGSAASGGGGTSGGAPSKGSAVAGDDSGCGCRVAGRGMALGWLALAAAAALAFARRRRRAH